ncbi:hypothetical protein ACIBCM_33235 [Streptomyces sp. NPDC051018]|uniref:hypothetical protein n=1 Tax=Streptomyces sp. NPDC051018 TaxID=3365639 RepID=UPI0037947A9D
MSTLLIRPAVGPSVRGVRSGHSAQYCCCGAQWHRKVGDGPDSQDDESQQHQTCHQCRKRAGATLWRLPPEAYIHEGTFFFV